MGKTTSTSDGATKTTSMEKVNIHEGRLRMLLQLLKDSNAKISIDYNVSGRPYATTYGEVKDAEHTLKDLFQNLWYKGDGTEITESAYYEYFKKDFTVNTRKTVNKKHHPSYEKYWQSCGPA